jgi:hypothetical protein
MIWFKKRATQSLGNKSVWGWAIRPPPLGPIGAFGGDGGHSSALPQRDFAIRSTVKIFIDS